MIGLTLANTSPHVQSTNAGRPWPRPRPRRRCRIMSAAFSPIMVVGGGCCRVVMPRHDRGVDHAQPLLRRRPGAAESIMRRRARADLQVPAGWNNVPVGLAHVTF